MKVMSLVAVSQIFDMQLNFSCSSLFCLNSLFFSLFSKSPRFLKGHSPIPYTRPPPPVKQKQKS
jgi:hypothetical protein